MDLKVLIYIINLFNNKCTAKVGYSDIVNGGLLIPLFSIKVKIATISLYLIKWIKTPYGNKFLWCLIYLVDLIIQ